MRGYGRGVPTAVIPVLVAVAVLGYVAGHSRSQGQSNEKLRTARSANVVVDYPAGWAPVAQAPAIPRLSIVRPIVLAPHGNAVRAALLVGSLPRGELSPLPGRFVSSLRQLPDTEVVNLLEIQAYKYAHVSIPGFDKTLTIFVIPNPGGDPTALACYGPSARSAEMQACEQTVATVTVVGQSQTYELTPEPNYARKISASVSSLDRLRAELRRELRPHVTAAAAQALANRIADGLSHAATSLSAIEPAFAAGQAQAALSASILRARDAYGALAAAAGEESASGYAAARRRIAQAESDVDWALENYALLGYNPTFRSPAGARS
jgi:hypothetical protein